MCKIKKKNKQSKESYERARTDAVVRRVGGLYPLYAKDRRQLKKRPRHTVIIFTTVCAQCSAEMKAGDLLCSLYMGQALVWSVSVENQRQK